MGNIAYIARGYDYMKSKTACFTGHRIIAREDLPHLVRRLNKTIENLVSQGVVNWMSGGAIGFDTLAAQAVIKQRETNPAVKLIMILPCRDQDARWCEADRSKYRQLLDASDEVVCLSEHYYDGCMAARNRYLALHSGVCVAYMNASAAVRVRRYGWRSRAG